MAEEGEAPKQETLRFLTPEKCFAVREQFGTPCYVYDEASLKAQAEKAVAFPTAFGLHARFAMKAAPNAAILKVFYDVGMWIDASSGPEDFCLDDGFGLEEWLEQGHARCGNLNGWIGRPGRVVIARHTEGGRRGARGDGTVNPEGSGGRDTCEGENG